MMRGRLETVEDRPALRFERHLEHSVQRVWRAITVPGELARWFVAPVEWKPELGETWSAMGQAGEITELEAERVLAWTWGNERFRFELRGDRDGCLLAFTHVFDDRTLGAQHAAGWDAYLDRLDAHLAGGFLSEQEAHRAVPERQQRYAESFGPDAEAGRRVVRVQQQRRVSLEDGPKLRLERRYEHSVERVWKAITDPQELRHWFPPGEALTVTESEPPRLLAGWWFGDELRFELHPDGNGCVLVFSHAFADREKAARDGAGWDCCFARFDALLAGEPISEADSLDAWPEIHERYAAAFGVDPELGRKAFAEHQAQQ
jgi:uncharacterized protein YndB with AHSA1/START domain